MLALAVTLTATLTLTVTVTASVVLTPILMLTCEPWECPLTTSTVRDVKPLDPVPLNPLVQAALGWVAPATSLRQHRGTGYDDWVAAASKRGVA
jgi:hypothetical protein